MAQELIDKENEGIRHERQNLKDAGKLAAERPLKRCKSLDKETRELSQGLMPFKMKMAPTLKVKQNCAI